MLSRIRVLLAVGLAVLLPALAVAWVFSRPEDKPPPEKKEPQPAEVADLAPVRKMAEAYTQAFNKADVDALAATWKADGEYTGPEGTLKGRAAIGKAYADFFKANPGVTLSIQIESLRLLGKDTALEDGILRLTHPKHAGPSVTRYSAVHVREGDRWLTAMVREVEVDPADLVSLSELQWLVGKWYAKSDTAELNVEYTWDADKKFLVGTFDLKLKDKPAISGTLRIGKDAVLGQLRSWVFEKDGGIGEGFWSRDGDGWVVDTVGRLPDGIQTTSISVYLPAGADAFTFQTIQRTVGGVAVPDLPPIKVTRVKK